MLDKALELLKAQRGAEGSLEYGIAEVLEVMCRENTQTAELIALDLTVKEMSLSACGKSLYDYASKNRKGNSFYLSPTTAQQLICDFYKLPQASVPKVTEPPMEQQPARAHQQKVVSLLDLI